MIFFDESETRLQKILIAGLLLSMCKNVLLSGVVSAERRRAGSSLLSLLWDILMKKLLFTLLAGITLAAIAPKHMRADVGDACVDANGHSGYMISTGRGGETCQASDGGL